MQTQELLINFYCSEEFRQGLDNQIICLSVITILLGITAIFGTTVILIALCKETSLHKPSKVLIRNLVVSDLCVGFVQLLSVVLLSPFCEDGGKLSLSLFGLWYSSQNFDNSIIVDNNRHKRGQTFGSVLKTQVQTSGHH